MKILKGLLITLGVLVALFFILNLFGPSNYKVERSKIIEAPVSVVFDQVAKFNNWDSWSPWKEKDPSATYTLAGEDGKVGTRYAWSGDPETTGEGSMTVSESIANEKFAYDLAFTAPWEMSSKGHFDFNETDGQTTVTWIDEGDIPFMQRGMMLFMDLDEMMGPDFERGLEKIDSLSVVLANNASSSVEIIETDFPGGMYVGVRNNTTTEEAMTAQFYETNFGKIGAFLGKNQIEMTDAPVALTYVWDMENNVAEVVPAFPVSMKVDVEDGLEFIEIENSKAVMVKHYGPYTSVGSSHKAIGEYLAGKNLEHTVVIEIYANDPSEVAQEEVLTEIYYLLK
ncbi:MAG TPA: hypothetical protein EYG86_06320 [Crocinitomicaceae bacterium]|nr:hypothetical protein [Crocinitomicaceae bacterium]